MDLLVVLDRSCRRALRRQLEDQLRAAIRSGRIPAGCDLPSTRALAADLSVSRGVVVRAYAQLAAEGYLALRHGSAASVRDLDARRLLPARQPATPSDAPPKVHYDLRPHLPAIGQFPRQSWGRFLARALTGAADADLGYVDERGLAQLRTELSAYLGRARGVAAPPDRIVITSGSTQALSLIAGVLRRHGARGIGLENPSHRTLRMLAEQAGLSPIAIPVDDDGIDVDALPLSNPAAVIVSPGRQFPTGRVLSGERRTAILRWASQSERLIVEYDYDADFCDDAAAAGALQALEPEHVAYVGSTGKTLVPGIRLGWAVLPAGLAGEVAEALRRSVLQVSPIDQLAFADFLRRGEFDRHLRRMRILYRGRRDALSVALAHAVPDVPICGSDGGLYLVLQLDSLEREQAAYRRARMLGLELQTLSEHGLPGGPGRNGLVVGIGGLPDAAVPRVVAILARALA